MTARVTVVAVTYEPDETLDAFLDSLPAASADAVPVVLADNGDPSAPLAPVLAAAAERPGVRVVRTGGNLGYGRGANAGVAQTDTEFVLVANPDLVWRAGAVDRLVAAADRWPDGASFGPRILTPDGRTYPSARDLPSLGRGIGHALAGWWWPANPWTAAYRREREEPVERAAGWLSGSCLMVRRTAWDAVGGFDPAYFMYFEDVDLGERLGRVGPNVYVPDAVVVHLGGRSTGRAPVAMARAHHASAWTYLSRRYAGPRRWPLRAAIRAGLATRAAVARVVPRVAAGARLAGSAPGTSPTAPPIGGDT